MVADSAVTRDNNLITSHSTFGELHRKIKGKNVGESLLKLVPITDDLVISFSGNFTLAKNIIQFIKDSYSFSQNISSILSNIPASCGPFIDDKRISL
ncbi:MAG: hypothetical protein ACE5JB_16785, partial [bacterium]